MKQAKPGTKLWKIGVWATIWWAATCSYILLAVWMGKDYYVKYADVWSGGTISDWSSAIGNAWNHSATLPVLLLVLALGWVVGAVLWRAELRRQKISYKSALEDVFLTLRK
jgi:hypothetical protein